MLTALLGACGKKENAASRDVTTQAVGTDIDLPKECVEAEAAQRQCTETLATEFERVGRPDAAKQLRDSFTKEMESTRARWRAHANKDGLAKSCAMMRDGLRAQPQCHPR
jgi:hypothetical protein